MNWYQVFYWVAVADGVKGFFDAVSNWLFFFTIVSFIIMIICTIGKGLQVSADSTKTDQEDAVSPDIRAWDKIRRPVTKMFYWFMCLTIVTWSCYVFCPSKKDAVLIIAGGAVGNFITSDSSAKHIPAELTLLIREKMRSEIQDLKSEVISDTLTSKTKEELIELLKKK